MGKMAIMHLHTENRLYGAEINTLSLLSYLSKEKFQVFLACLYEDESDLGFLKAAKKLSDVKILPIKMSHKYDILAVRNLRVLLKKHHIQILHTHGYKADIVGFLASRFLRVRLISTLHGWVETNLKLKFNNILSKQSLKLFHKVIVLSKILEEETAKYINRGKIAYIRNAVDTERLNEIKPLDLNKALGIEKDALVITYVGRLSKEKGVDYLVKAASLLIRKNEKIIFIFVGDGSMRNKLEKLKKGLNLEKRMYFTGFRKDALRILRATDLFVLPSLTEGISRSCMEAMGLGILVLATDVGGMSELIEDGVNGFSVSPRRADILAKKMEMILRKKDMLGSLKSKAIETIKERFSMKRMAREHEELYDVLIRER